MTSTRLPVVFVLMGRDPSSEERFTLGVRPACEAALALVRRLEDVPLDTDIFSRVYAELGNADIVVADASSRGPNVWYELGVAHTLGRPTVLIAEQREDVRFGAANSRVIVYGGDLARLRTELTRAVTALLRPQRPRAPVSRSRLTSEQRVSTLVFGDVVGTSKMNLTLGELSVTTLLRRYFGQVRDLADTHHVYAFRTMGDTFIAAFEDTLDALDFALALRRVSDTSQEAALEVRLAVHSAAIEVRRTPYGEDLVGAGVDLAARLSTVAAPNQILLTQEAARRLPPDRLPPSSTRLNLTLKHGIGVDAFVIDAAPRRASDGSD